MRKLLAFLPLLLASPLLAVAQDAGRRGADMTGWSILSTLVYGLLGIALCVLGYFAFDKIAGLSLQHELVEDQNVALGIMLAGVFIGIAIVIGSVMLS
jgi:uncharacterized membrane protein YjfL (UPF0719 family)